MRTPDSPDVTDVLDRAWEDVSGTPTAPDPFENEVSLGGVIAREWDRRGQAGEATPASFEQPETDAVTSSGADRPDLSTPAASSR